MVGELFPYVFERVGDSRTFARVLSRAVSLDSRTTSFLTLESSKELVTVWVVSTMWTTRTVISPTITPKAHSARRYLPNRPCIQ